MRGWALSLSLAAGAAVAAKPAPVSVPALQDRLCTATAASAPVAATAPGCSQAFCTAVGAQSLCACERAEGWRFERREGGRVQQHWRTEISPLMGASAFEVTLADLDGDGQPEWLVALLQSVSNGLGVSHHTLCTVTPGRPGVPCRDVSEWGALSVPVAEAGRPGCSLINADWQSGREPGREHGRGDGTYAVARLLRWQGGRWVPAPTAQRPDRRDASQHERHQGRHDRGGGRDEPCREPEHSGELDVAHAHAARHCEREHDDEVENA